MIEVNDYDFLRNDYTVREGVSVDGIKYPTAEHAFQAAKTRDLDERLRMSKMTISELRRYAHNIEIDVYEWDSCKYFVMNNVLMCKFSQNKDIADKLTKLDGDIEMVSDTDSFWGTGPNGMGDNALGDILSIVRQSLIEDQDRSDDLDINDFDFNFSNSKADVEEDEPNEDDSESLNLSNLFKSMSNDIEEVFIIAEEICDWHTDMPGALAFHPELEKLIEKLGDKVADAKKEIRDAADRASRVIRLD